ncbi:FIG00761799: membrane protein, partial [hydrothermal vent metagenome]
MENIESNKSEQNSVVNGSPTKDEVKGAWHTIKQFVFELLDIRLDTDKKGTIEDIKGNISMKGHTAWVLVFSILIASIGLNISSTAVVIGAMLISPLMGPILGVGLSIGINDIDTLKRSLINLGVMIGLSLATS